MHRNRLVFLAKALMLVFAAMIPSTCHAKDTGQFQLSRMKISDNVLNDSKRKQNGRIFVGHASAELLFHSKSRDAVLNIRAGGKAKEVKSKKHAADIITTSEQLILPNVPIFRKEFRQFILTSFLMFFFIIIFTMTRDTKDSLVVSNCGAEAIPFLKLYGVMPAATLFLVGYSKLSNVLSKKALFYATLYPFFIFYVAFAFILFPTRNKIHPTSFLASNTRAIPLINLLRYWSFSLYFIVTELYAGAGVPLLFWQFANDVTSLQQAKRFYPLFAVVGNLAPIFSGKIMTFVISRQKSNDDVSYGETLKYLALIKCCVCACIVTIYSVLEKLTKNANNAGVQDKRRRMEEKQPIKKKTTLRESMKELSRNKELRSIAMMVMCYNICVELAEVLWKGILRKRYTNKSDYMNFMGMFSQIVGITAFILQLCSPIIIKIMGWRGTSLLTPYIMGTLATLFFVSVSAGRDLVPLHVALIVGTLQNIACKVTKYTLFDPCKEMAYIPLGPEAKVKGKAAVEVLGGRVGRSIGSASQQIMVLTAGGSILNCAPALGAMYLFSIYNWSKAVNNLAEIVEDLIQVALYVIYVLFPVENPRLLLFNI